VRVEQGPSEAGHRTFIATVVFIDIVGYSERLVTQQVELKTRLNGLVANVLQNVPVTDRMMLDTGDGAALCFLGDPEDALFAASNLRASTVAIGPELALRIGINLGPLRIVKDVNGQPNMLGDGINVAQRVMSFAEPNQILVSRSYYEIVSRLSQEYTRLFQYVGVHRDKHVREHEVYVMTAGGEGATAPEPEQAAAAAASGPPGRVESTEFVPVGGVRFDPAVLARVEGALADSLGPVARILVRKAAKTARDVPTLCQQLDVGLPEAQRAEFRRRLGDVAGPPSAPPAPKPATSRPAAVAAPAATSPPARPLSPAVLDEAADRLAIHIGPVAKLLVKRAAKQASSTRDLYERLAAHIDDPQSRQRFTAAVEELSEP
jgi:class 3 adenylate cyclase